MEENNNPNRTSSFKEDWESLKDEFRKKKVSDIGVFTVREKDFILIKWFKLTVNYTMFGFVMFMTFVVLSLTLLAA
jgi:hypothetical protein